MISLEASANAFLSTRPEWTVAGATLSCDVRGDVALEQTPFRWVDGVWEADVLVHPEETKQASHKVLMVIRPETTRRWKEIGINPFLEARAQLKEHLHSIRPALSLSQLLLL